MCGRYTLTAPFEEIRDHFLPDFVLAGPWRSKEQVFPSEQIPVVAHDGGKRVLRLMRWGLIPSWSREFPKTALINARAETLALKPSFREAFAARRCLIPAQAFLEWKTEGRRKIPYRIACPERPLFAMGGLWERWKAPDGEILDSVAIVTTAPNALLESIHDRMPLILAPEDYARWLDPNTSRAEIISLLRPFQAMPMCAAESEPELQPSLF